MEYKLFDTYLCLFFHIVSLTLRYLYLGTSLCVPSLYHVAICLFNQHPSGLHHLRSVYQQGAPSFLETGKVRRCQVRTTEDPRRCPNEIAHAARLVCRQYADVHCRATEQFHTRACLFGKIT